MIAVAIRPEAAKPYKGNRGDPGGLSPACVVAIRKEV